MISRLKSFFKTSYFLPFLSAFAVWVFSFRHFMFGKLAFVEDAISYLNQTKFLTDAMLQGSLLLWNHEAFGMPNDFFLLRLGAFNPLYSLLTMLRFSGMSFITAYTWLLAGYYFLGCYGFYLLAKKITQNRLASFFGFLLLYFSAFGTRLFDSYLVLVFVPLIWFFFFMTDFFMKPSRKSFLGIVFTMMLLLSTYIPFYFVFILLVFMVLVGIVFPKYFLVFSKRLLAFIAGNKVLFIIGIFAVMIALIPGILFFQSSARGDFVMPQRQFGADTALEVQLENFTTWALIEDVVFSTYFSDLRQFNFAIFYIPVLAWMLLTCGLFTRISKRLIFYLLFAGFFFILGMPRDIPLYNFLHQHIFFFKYFRNLHFFLWWLILPVMVLFIVEQTKQLLEMLRTRQRYWFFAAISVMHVFWLVMILLQPDRLVSTLVSIILSWLFFGLIAFKWKIHQTSFAGLAVLIVVVLQPMAVYHYLSSNSVMKESPYQYESQQEKSPYLNHELIVTDDAPQGSFYIAMRDIQELNANLSPSVFSQYTAPRFIVYDQVEVIEEQIDWQKIERTFAQLENKVFVDEWDIALQLAGEQDQRISITGPDQQVEILADKPGLIKLRTFFVQPKVLVVNDTFSPFWEADINGAEVPLYKANTAFKAVYVPAGEQVITLRFSKHVLLKTVIWFTYLTIFALLLFFTIKNRHKKNYEEAVS